MTTTDFKIVALDGGAASGKSSTSRGVAEKLKYLYVNSGEFYRILTHYFLEENIQSRNVEELEEALKKVQLENRVENGRTTLLFNGESVPEEELRSPVVNANVSLYAAKRPIRNFLMEPLRSQAQVAKREGFKGLIMEGRDIGTVVFPDADFKFFLSASEQIREQRRESEGQMDLVVQRDQLDSKRSAAPFVPADRSIHINTDEIGLEEVIALVCGIIMTGKVPGTMTKEPFPNREEEGWEGAEESQSV